MRLLNRDVKVILQGVDAFSNFFGTIDFPKGNITQKLLELGYAKLVSFGFGFPACTSLMPAVAALMVATCAGSLVGCHHSLR